MYSGTSSLCLNALLFHIAIGETRIFAVKQILFYQKGIEAFEKAC